MFSSSNTGKTGRGTLSSLSVLAATAMALMLSPAALSAQQKPARGTIIVPLTSVVRPQDRGIRAHTNYLIFVPAKGDKKPGPPSGSSGPAGETPGSLACIYQTVDESTAYGNGCPVSQATKTPSGGSGVIAIVDAYDYPTASSDFDTFSNQFGLPTGSNCNGGKTCFTKVAAGNTFPKSNGGWAQEEALDIEWSHAMAPNAQIILVEAASSSFTNLLAAVQVASNEVLCGKKTCPNGGNGVGEVSMSWGGSEFSREIADDSYFTNPGITYFASSGDTGGVVIWPSASPNVVSAGGTTVNRIGGVFTGETTWTDAGGGPSKYEPVPSYQNEVPSVSSLVGKFRGTPDFSFDANPASGVSVYDSTTYQGLSGWLVFGGTSVASPSLAGIANLAGHFYFGQDEQGLIYSTYGTTSGTCDYSTAFTDITVGSSGKQSAGPGWDFATGVGSNRGIACGK